MQLSLKRTIFWILLIGFSGAALYWFIHVPYRPQALYRLVPDNSVYMSHHRLLAERWDTFTGNPLIETFLASTGLDMDEINEWSGDGDIRPWLDTLLARDVLIAHSPALGPTHEPAWILAGWIGGESIRLRWLLQRGRLSGFQMEPRHGGNVYWLVETDDTRREQLSIALVEGVLIGVYSTDPHAVRHILDVYDGLTSRFPIEHVLRTPDEETELDFGWFRGLDLDGGETYYNFALSQADTNGLAGHISTDESGDWPRIGTPDIEIPSRIFGGLPFLMLGAEPDALYTFMRNRLPIYGSQILQGLYQTEPTGPVLAAVTGGDFAGSIFGISVPSITLAWPINDHAETFARVQELLDRLNAHWRWGLVAAQREVEGLPLYIIESTTNTAYARFRSREQVAYTIIDDWFVISTQSRPLIRLVGRYHRPEALVEADDGGWQPGLQTGDAAAHAFWDIRAGASTLRMAISAYSMKLMFEDQRGTREQREQLSTMRGWLDLMEDLGPIRAWLDQQDGYRTLRFSFGDTGESL